MAAVAVVFTVVEAADFMAEAVRSAVEEVDSVAEARFVAAGLASARTARASEVDSVAARAAVSTVDLTVDLTGDFAGGFGVPEDFVMAFAAEGVGEAEVGAGAAGAGDSA
jgi:hypothetical protein